MFLMHWYLNLFYSTINIQLGGVSYHDGNQVSQDEQREKLAQDLGPTNMVSSLHSYQSSPVAASYNETFCTSIETIPAGAGTP